MPDCAKCNSAVRGETGISCRGVCGKIYHATAKCSGICNYSSTCLDTNPMLKVMCDDCATYIHNVDFALLDIKEALDSNCRRLKESSEDFSALLKQNEVNLVKLMEAAVVELTNKTKSDREIKKLASEITDLKSELGKLQVENKSTSLELIKKINSKTSSNNSYADVIKNAKKSPPKIKNVRH